MGVKERYENRKKTIKEKDENKSNIGVAERYEMNKFSTSLPSRLESLTSTRDALYKDYTSRFTDKDGNYINAYRGDTKEALANFNSSKASIDKESKAILDDLAKYEKYLDADKVKEIQNYLSGYSNDLDGMYETYKTDHDYFSRYADEGSYNRAMNYAKEQADKKTKYSTMSDEELDAEIKRLEESKKGNKVTNFAMKYIGTPGVAGSSNLYAKAEANQSHNDAVDYDISLLEAEKTNRKYKQLDTLPEDVKALIDEYTSLDTEKDYTTIENIAQGFARAFNQNTGDFTAETTGVRRREIAEELESKGVDNWQELVGYNRILKDGENNKALNDETEKFAKEHPWLSSATTIFTSPTKMLGAVEMLENAVEGSDVPLNYNSPYFVGNDFINTTRETVMNERDFHLNTGNKTLDNIDIFDELYGTAMSMGDSVVAGVGLGGVGGVSLGFSAATDSAQEVAEKGGSATEAIVTGLVSGVNEMLWESLSLGRLNDLLTNGVSKRGFKAFVKELFKSMGINASEELNTEASNLLADYLINGGASTYSETVQNYLAMGYSDEEAKAQAKKDMLVQVAKAGVGGALQGLFMGGGAGGISTVSNAIDSKAYENKYYNKMGQNIIDQGNLSQLEEEANALGGKDVLKALKNLADETAGVKAEELDDKGKKKYAHQVGKLYKEVQKTQLKNLSESSKTAFKNVIKAELEKTGVDNVDATADILVKAAHNESLTRAESKLLQSVNGHDILNKAYSSKEFVKTLSTEEKKQFEESRDNILDTVDLTHDKGKAKILAESNYDVSSDGTTIIEATGEEVNLMSVDSLEGDDISFKVKNGDSEQVVLAGELRLNEDYVVILEGLKDIKENFGLDVSSANSVLALWDGYTGNAIDFSKAMKSGIMYGQYNLRKDFENSRMGRNIPDNIREELFRIGREYKQRVTDERESDVKANGNANAENGEFSITYAEGVTYESLNDSQKAQVDFAQVIAKTFGFNLEIFRSPKNALGQSVGENGSYNLGTNTMRLDVDAGELDGKSLILFTQSHELTHFIKKWSPKAFKTFADLLVEKYGKKGVSVDTLVNDKITQSIMQTKTDKTGKHHVLSYEEAFEEVVCDACEDFLADPNIQQTIAEFAKVDKNLAQKIKDFLKGLITKLEEAIKGLQGQSAEAEALREFDIEDLEDLKNHWAAALFDARENVLQAKQNDAKAQKNTTDEGDVKLEDRTFSYDELVAKGYIQGIVLGKQHQIKLNANGDIDRKYIFNFVKSQCERVQTNAPEPTYYLNVSDIGKNVEITNEGIGHGFIKWKKTSNGSLPSRSALNARVALALPEVLRNSIEVNRSDRNDTDVNFTHVMIGTIGLENNNGTVEYYAVRSMIQDRVNQDPVLAECEVLGKLYAINTKKIDSPRVQATKVALAHSKVYAYNIADFLEDVKGVFDDTFSDDVYKTLGVKRKENNFSGNLKFQDRDSLKHFDRSTDLYSRISEMQLEVNKLRWSMADIESSEEFKEEQRKLSEAFSKDVDSGIELYKKWLEESEYSKLKSKKDALEDELDKLRTERDNEISSKALEKEKNAIAKSGLSEADYFRKQAVKEFGYTPYFYDAGYITPNGKMLNFSGEKGKHYGSRGQDHRAIGVIYEETEGTDALNRFVKDGNIRIMAESPGIDISTAAEPTKEQYSTVNKFISEYANKEFFNVDFTDENGKVIGSLQYEGRINSTRIINDIKHYYATGEIREQSSVDKFLYSDRNIELEINQSMTMEQAKTMIQKAFVLGGILEWYEGEYKNGDEWIRGVGTREVALNIESEYTLMDKYFNDIQGYIDGDIYVEDVLDAYLAGTLIGKQAEKIKRLDVGKGYDVTDNRFYAPKKYSDIKTLWETANAKVTKANKSQVNEARKSFLFAAHNMDVAKELNITPSEVNKKLRSWSNYSANAKDISTRLNNGVAASNQWSGIQNCSILSQISVTDEDISSMVKEIKGTSSEYQRNYIARTMLALNTHIDWSELIFDFKKGFVDEKRRSVKGLYKDSERTITIGGSSYQNTVAHEMGHALDYKWQRDLFGEHAYNSALSANHTRLDLIKGGEEAQQFYKNFRNFIKSLTDVTVNYSAYTMDAGETFARFVARFVEWVNLTANNNAFRETDFYGDKFTASQYIEFVKLLQEKAMLDAKKMSNDTLEDVKFQDRVTPEQGAEYLELAKNPEKNKARLREMVDSVAKANGYTIKAYHGGDKFFTVFGKGNKTSQAPEGAYFFSSNKDVAYSYTVYKRDVNTDVNSYPIYEQLTREGTLEKNRVTRGGVYSSYLKIQNPYIVDFGGEYYSHKINGMDINETVRFAIENEYDGVIAKNIKDPGDMGDVNYETEKTLVVADDYIIFDSSKIKSAEPVTYDDDGNIIPLSERFNEGNDDIRYQDRTSNGATFNGKPFWSGSVSLIDGVIEEVHSYQEAEAVDFHHSLYFSQTQVEKMESGENAFFFVENGRVNGDWRESVSANIIKKIEEQITFNTDARFQDRPYQPSLEDLGIDYKEENEKLKADVDRLKEMLKLQGTVTHGKALAKASYEGVAKKLLHEFGMKRVTDTEVLKEFINKLDSFYSYIINEDDLIWEDMFDKSMKIARWMDSILPEQVVYKNPNAVEILRDIREKGIMLSDKQKEEATYYAGSLNAYRKMNIGNFKIVNEGGISLTDLWEQLVSHYPGAISKEYIQKGEVAENLPSLIVEVVDIMRQTEKVINDDNRLSHLREIATAIYDSYWQIPTVRTLADKHQQKVNLLKGQHKAEMDALKEKNDSKLKDTKEYYQDMVKRIRADKDAKMDAYKERVQEQKKKNVEGRNKTATKNKIKRVVKELDKLLNKGNKKSNVKDGMQDMVKQALALSDLLLDDVISAETILSADIPDERLSDDESAMLKKWRDAVESRAKFQATIDNLEEKYGSNKPLKAYEELVKSIEIANKSIKTAERNLSGLLERERKRLNSNSVKTAIESLSKAYEMLKESNVDYISSAYDKNISDKLKNLVESLEGVNVKDMSLRDLQEVYTAYKMVLTTVRNANKLFVNGRKEDFDEINGLILQEISSHKKKKESKFEPADKVLEGARNFTHNNLKPLYFFEELGSDALKRIFYDEIARAQRVYAVDYREAREYIENARKKHNYYSWNNDSQTIKLLDGRTVKFSMQELMSIYAYSKRPQADKHMSEGGFACDNKAFFKDVEVDINGKKVKTRELRSDAETPYRITEFELAKIKKLLGKERCEYVDDMQKYLSEDMANKGNSVTRIMYGIDIFNEKVYFPLKSSKDYKIPVSTTNAEFSLKGSGFTKETVPSARNPIVLEGFEDVWAKHVNEMSTYHSLVLPIENMNKVLGYTEYINTPNSLSTKQIIRKVYGSSALNYIENYIQDMNGGFSSNKGAQNFFAKGFSNFKKTAVGASMSTVIQQPTAILRAMSMINPKYFVKYETANHKVLQDEMFKYAPISVIKQIGGFDAGGNGSAVSSLLSKEYKGIDKAKAFFEDKEYRKESFDDAMMLGATFADEIGWNIIWNAVKNEVKDTTTFTPGTDEFLNECGNRFDEVINATQVYDSVLSRSGYMRSNNELVKMSTAFMGEPSTSFNMLFNAVTQAKRGNISKTKAVGIVTSVYASVIAAAALKSLIYALRDDDDEESYVEKYMSALSNSLKEELWIHNMLPFLSDIATMFDGWEVERTDIAVFKDVVDAFNDLDSSSKSDWRKAEDLFGAFAGLFGIPLKNVMRTGREIYNAYANIFDGITADDGGVGNAIVESLFGEVTMADANEALEKGKTDKAKEIISDLVADKVEEGKTEKEAKTSIKSSVTGYWKPLYLQAYRDNDSAEMLRIRRILQSTGLYDNVVETCSNWIKGMKEETTDTTYKKW